MRRRKPIVALGILFVFVCVGLFVSAANEHGSSRADQMGHMGHFVCPMKIDGANVAVKNIKEGVVIRITSKDAAMVKAIQEAAAQMKKHHAVTPTQKQGAKKEVWACPMGCYVGPKTDDGRCPMCGMTLKKRSQ